MLKLTIDGIEVEARDGNTILEAADGAGIYIPRLCSHPDLPAVDPAQLEPWDEVFQGTLSRRHANSAGPARGPSKNGRHEGCLDVASPACAPISVEYLISFVATDHLFE